MQAVDSGHTVDPTLWTVDWRAGLLGGAVEVCEHFADNSRPIFDLASVTKVAVTSTLLAELFVDFNGDLAQFFLQTIAKEIPELKGTPLENTTVGELWEHRSGLRAHRLLFSNERKVLSRDRKVVWRHFLEELKTETLTIPKTTIYSDLGFLLLGCWLERKRGKTLDALFQDWKSKRQVQAPTLMYGVESCHQLRVPRTEERHPVAQVNDDNCFCMGGVASHAGLFGTVNDLWAWLEALANWSASNSKIRDEWLNPRAGIERFHAGWDTPSTDLSQPSQAGLGAPSGTVGHLGFTGTSVWFNVKTRQAGVLLTNRVRPADSMQSRALIRKLRQEFYKELWHNGSLKGSGWKAVLNSKETVPI